MKIESNPVLKLYRIFRFANFFKNHTYILPRIAGNYFKRFFLGKDIVRNVEFALDYRCNAKCIHCSTTSMDSRHKKKLTTEQAKKVIDQCRSVGTTMLILTGGEPTLRPDLEELVAYVRSKKMLPLIGTNALLLNEERILSLKKAGIFAVTVSLHGLQQTHENTLRVPGSYDTAITALKNLKKHKVIALVSYVVFHQSLNGELDAVVRLMDELDVRLNLDYPCSCGELKNSKDQLLSEEELKTVKEYEKMINVSSDLKNNYGEYGCPAGNECFYITSAGEVCPCPFIQISYGNVFEESLKKIWGFMRTSPAFSKLNGSCLAAERHEFIKDYLDPIHTLKKGVPLNVRDHPMFNRKENFDNIYGSL